MATINYNPLLTGIADGQIVRASHLTTNFQAIQASINSGNIEISDLETFQKSIESAAYVRAFDTTKLSYAANTINIAADATILYSNSVISGFPSASINVSAFSSGILWSVNGIPKSYTVTNFNDAPPANAYVIGFFTNASGSVNVGINLASPWETQTNVFNVDNLFQGIVTVRRQAIINGASSLNRIGDIIATNRPTLDADLLPCNGAAYNTTVYADLFAATGSGVLPDLRDRVVIGAGLNYAFRAYGGAATNIHTHSYGGSTSGPSNTGAALNGGGVAFTYTNETHTHNFSGNTAGPSDGNNMPPYHALNIGIKWR